MDALNDLENSLDALKRDLNRRLNEKQNYLNTASKIGVIYGRLKNDKDTVSDYRKSLKSFAREDYDSFKGNLYKNEYRAQAMELVATYDRLISLLDDNLDKLNSERAKYENLAYQCDGLIGYLRSAINSVAHQIENWVN